MNFELRSDTEEEDFIAVRLPTGQDVIVTSNGTVELWYKDSETQTEHLFSEINLLDAWAESYGSRSVERIKLPAPMHVHTQMP